MLQLALLDPSSRLHLHIILLCCKKSLRGWCAHSHAGLVFLAARADLQQCHASLHAVMIEIGLSQSAGIACNNLQHTACDIMWNQDALVDVPVTCHYSFYTVFVAGLK